MKCYNPHHDHELEHNDVPGHCNDCGLPAHYDEGTGWYHHDDDNAEPCFLTSPNTGDHTECELPNYNQGLGTGLPNDTDYNEVELEYIRLRNEGKIT